MGENYKIMIPENIQKDVRMFIEKFNNEELDLINEFYKYFAEFKGKHVYLKTKKYDTISPIARLTYTGDINKWKFAIYRFSSGNYDADEMFFPGAEHIDGTVSGALYACNKAYPPA